MYVEVNMCVRLPLCDVMFYSQGRVVLRASAARAYELERDSWEVEAMHPVNPSLSPSLPLSLSLYVACFLRGRTLLLSNTC